MDSVVAMELLPNAYFDFIFIDADHRYDCVIRDLRGFLPKLKPGGIICGDDCEVYYDQLPPEFINANANCDYSFLNGFGYHCGVIKALHECWGTDYELTTFGDGAAYGRFWWKRVDGSSLPCVKQ